ncbi:Thioredoxin-related protein [Formosa sp. Hel1_31_208]|uniref:thioredoxin family protein n=1 Tax=Formosa sp. Hel1_31_208 TaxID=1798225 RepID=UPI00087A0543|nr:thioredoxin family protein [Formosa sp. Hel1_31_208]SDS43545.1 Thioredoxin-related protein [Formosa sp. Hel1_31_208]
MNKSICLIVLLLAMTSAHAQHWLTDFDEAKAVALKEQKTIILVFQGSDWCAPCIKLDKEIWQTEEFQNYAKDHFVMLKADFPKRKKNALSETLQAHNNKLAETYNKSGYFPYVVVLDEKGKMLASSGYKKTSPTEYIKFLEAFKS